MKPSDTGSKGKNLLITSSAQTLWHRFRSIQSSLPASVRRRFWIRLGIGFIFAVAVCAGVTWLGKWLDPKGMTAWDRTSLRWIVEELPLFSFYNATIFESFGNIALTVPILVFTMIIAIRRKDALVVPGFFLGYALLRPLIYAGWWVWDRARPELVAGGIAAPPFHSYPSGHATISIFVYGFLTWLWWRATGSRPEKALMILLLGVLLFLVGWARLRLGTHWPSDIVAGFFIGGVWLGGVVWAIKAGDHHHNEHSPIG
jgi:undecaprenyl-diphosphatase